MILIKAECPPCASAAGYLPPGPPDRPHEALEPALLRFIHPDVLESHAGRHRVAIWGSMPRRPFALIGPLLRHELEHASQHRLYGKPLFELNAALREAWTLVRGVDDYLQLPVERQANLAAARYAAERLRPRAIERARGDREYRQLVDTDAPELEGGVIDLTLDALREALAGGAQLTQPFADGEIDELERRARTCAESLDGPHDAAPGLVVTSPWLKPTTSISS